ncbi:MAG: 7-carboxy-7-deazaguanine synthase QueE [Sphingomonadales bacterium]|nr:7-carboxy-7-deazaguanine synthase QueE [Sphingomonadales bacterium]
MADKESKSELIGSLVGTLPVMETFYTLQGEGANQGRPAFFVRLGGCDVGCVWCDVKDSWPADGHPHRTIEELIQEIQDAGTPHVVITGGEPTLYDLNELCRSVRNMGVAIWLETAGTGIIRGIFDWICLSPKKFKPVLEENYRLAHELKVVIYHKSDLEWAHEQALRVNDSCALYLQPEWSRERAVLDLIIPFLLENPRWRLSLQTHKYLGVR